MTGRWAPSGVWICSRFSPLPLHLASCDSLVVFFPLAVQSTLLKSSDFIVATMYTSKLVDELMCQCVELTSSILGSGSSYLMMSSTQQAKRWRHNAGWWKKWSRKEETGERKWLGSNNGTAHHVSAVNKGHSCYAIYKKKNCRKLWLLKTSEAAR